MFGKAKSTLGYGKVDTIIGEGTELKGTIQSSGVLRIDGFFEGNISHEGELIVGPKGRLIATVKAQAMAIAGEVRGEVTVEGKLEILTSGRLIGDTASGHLVIQEGAVFQGRSLMAGQLAEEAASS